MTLLLSVLLVLYLSDKKAVRIIEVCLLPAFIILPAFFRLKTTEGLCFYAGLIIIGAAPLIEILFEKLSKRLSLVKKAAGQEDTRGAEDIVDNRKKWILIKTGFAAALILALVLFAAVLTLNSKVNSMYRFTTKQQETIEDQQRQIDALKERVEKK